MKLYEAIYTALLARQNCATPGFANPTAIDGWDEVLDDLETNFLPRGSGFDCGTRIVRDLTSSGGFKLTTDFHHMDEHGGYDGWTEHMVHVTPSFIGGFDMTVSGRNRNQIKDWIGSQFGRALGMEGTAAEFFRAYAKDKAA